MEDKRTYLRRRTDYFLIKSIYIMFFGIMLLIGAFFYSQYKISIIESNQKQAIQLFKMYSEKDLRQQQSIEDLRRNLELLDKKIESNYSKFDQKLDNIMKLILKK